MGGRGLPAQFNKQSNEKRKEERDRRRYSDFSKKQYGYEKDHFKNDSLKWQSKMNKDELNAVQLYTGHSYREINKYLRNGLMGSGKDEHMEQIIRNAFNGLNKFELKEGIMVYRKSSSSLLSDLGVSYSEGLWGVNQADLKSFVDKINTRIGSVVQDKGFTSTSTRKDVWAGDVHYEIRVPAGTSGAYVEHVSVHQSEKEFILNHGTYYKVTGARIENNVPVVTLQVVKASGRKKS